MITVNEGHLKFRCLCQAFRLFQMLTLPWFYTLFLPWKTFLWNIVYLFWTWGDFYSWKGSSFLRFEFDFHGICIQNSLIFFYDFNRFSCRRILFFQWLNMLKRTLETCPSPSIIIFVYFWHKSSSVLFYLFEVSISLMVESIFLIIFSVFLCCLIQ